MQETEQVIGLRGLDETVALLTQVRSTIQQHYPDWQLGDLAVAGAGLSFLVCRAETVRFGPVAVRVPWVGWIVDENDPGLAARHLLQQEAAIAEHLHAQGHPVPAVRALHLGADGFDFLASEFIVQDGSRPDQVAFGRLMRAIHACPVPVIHLAEQTDQPFSRTIAARITRRIAVVERLASLRLRLPRADTIAALLADRDAVRALLHLDARPANLFTRNGAIVAIADWGNALVGDPALELARIAESGYLDAAFLSGYGDPAPFAALPPGVEAIYRLDVALILAIVFLSEAPDQELAAHYVGRVHTLETELRAFVG